jgi:hypothetical protein
MEIGLPSGEFRKGVSKAGSIGARQPHSDRRGWREGGSTATRIRMAQRGRLRRCAGEQSAPIGGHRGATVLGLGLVLHVLVVKVPFLQDAFGITALTLLQWDNWVVIASIILQVEEIRKLLAWLVRR